MGRVNDHLRRTFFAGIFAAVPLAVTGIIVWYVEAYTRQAVKPIIGRDLPFVGVGLSIILIYLAGLVVTSLMGQYLLGVVDRLLSRLPGVGSVYRVWKQVALTPAGTMGTFAKAVLIRDETGSMRLIGFCSGHGIPGDEGTLCVFVPNYPNPIVGRLYFVPAEQCIWLEMSADEAFKAIVSGGNYMPEEIGRRIAAARKGMAGVLAEGANGAAAVATEASGAEGEKEQGQTPEGASAPVGEL